MGKVTILVFLLGFMCLQIVTSRNRNRCFLIQCGSRRSPVCASDGKTYRSACHFVKALCLRNRPVLPRLKQKGRCKRSFICSLPKSRGPCRANYKRYYYNKYKKRCMPFRFGGCHGNKNNFPSYSRCKSYCGKYARLHDLDRFEDQIDHLSQDQILENDKDMFGKDGKENFVDKIRNELENDQGNDETEFDRKMDDANDNPDEGELKEGNDPDRADRPRDDDRRDEEMMDEFTSEDDDDDANDADDDEANDDGDDANDADDDDAYENEIKYNNKVKHEGTKTHSKNSVADASRVQAAPKSTYASCEKGMCELNISPVGCFNDNHQALRPLPHLVDSHRDPTSHAYHGSTIDWKNFESSIRKLACDCVKLARQRNYTHIGLQNYGECWAGNVTNKQYAINGKSNNCVNGTYKPCEKGKFCIGKEKTNFVYKIEPIVPSCELGYEKVGCFHDPVKTDNRPMPELLDSHRDQTSNSYHGLLLDWKNYRNSLKILIDHCAKRTKAKGYSHFGIQHYGECWSGERVDKTYSMYGNSTNCVNADFEKCNSKYACQCTGKENANFVYKLI